jgi:hypothetical protein
MHIDIEDRDALVLQPKVGGRNRAVVQKAEAAREIAIGMMTGRPANA